MLAARRYPRPWLATWLLLLACDDVPAQHADEDGDAASPVLDAAPRAGSAAEPPDAGEPVTTPEASVANDAAAAPGPTRRPTNVSFETALRLQPGQAPVLQDEVSAVQIDYFVFEGKAGSFYEMTTDMQTFSPDVVVSLYDAERTLLAQNDDGGLWPGNGTDARLIVRVPEDGDYYIVVEDPYTPQGFFEGSFSLLFYHLALREIDADTSGFVRGSAGEPTAVELELDVETGYRYATVFGELGDDDTTFELEASANIALIGRSHVSGPMGNGSSVLDGEVSVAGPELGTLARIDRASGHQMFDPPLDEGTHQVTIRAGESLGDNPFYSIDLILIEDNPIEHDAEDNSRLEYAEALDLPGMPGTARQGFVLLTLENQDVDYFSFEANANERVDLACEAESGGSGVRGLHVEVRDPTDQVLATSLEQPLSNAELQGVQLNATGTFYLRLWSEGLAEGDPVLAWARCGLIVRP